MRGSHGKYSRVLPGSCGAGHVVGTFLPISSANIGLSIEGKVSWAWQTPPALPRQGPETSRIWACDENQRNPGWPPKESEPSLQHRGVVSSGWKVGECHTCRVCRAGFHSHSQGCFIFSPSPAALLPLSRFHLLPVSPWQVLKVMVTAERMALTDYSREKEASNNHRK